MSDRDGADVLVVRDPNRRNAAYGTSRGVSSAVLFSPSLICKARSMSRKNLGSVQESRSRLPRSWPAQSPRRRRRTLARWSLGESSAGPAHQRDRPVELGNGRRLVHEIRCHSSAGLTLVHGCVGSVRDCGDSFFCSGRRRRRLGRVDSRCASDADARESGTLARATAFTRSGLFALSTIFCRNKRAVRGP